jgi:hypothetical protein
MVRSKRLELVVVAAALTSGGCGGSEATVPRPVRVDVAAASPAPEPPRADDGCSERRLGFSPRAGARYEMSVEDSDRSTPYRSEIVFTPRIDGWTAVESRFSGPFTPAQVGDLADAALHWTLDAAGVPSAPPEHRGGGRPDVVPNLSLFAFRPVGLVLETTCTDDASMSTWTDSIGRVRSFRFGVSSADDERIVLHVAGSVRTAANVWDLVGEVTVAVEDGLTSEARFHETGPGAPAVNDRERVIRIARR